jgi:hypothetical protein
MSQTVSLQIMQLTCIHWDPVPKPRANYQHFALLRITSVPQEKADAVSYLSFITTAYKVHMASLNKVGIIICINMHVDAQNVCSYTADD